MSQTRGRRKRGFSNRNIARKELKRKIASAQIEEILSVALQEHRTNQELAKKQAELVWRISTRHNIRLKEKRMLFCHYCKQFIVPPTTARYRLSKKRKSINITCLKCWKTYRMILAEERKDRD